MQFAAKRRRKKNRRRIHKISVRGRERSRSRQRMSRRRRLLVDHRLVLQLYRAERSKQISLRSVTISPSPALFGSRLESPFNYPAIFLTPVLTPSGGFLPVSPRPSLSQLSRRVETHRPERWARVGWVRLKGCKTEWGDRNARPLVRPRNAEAAASNQSEPRSHPVDDPTLAMVHPSLSANSRRPTVQQS